MAGKKIILRNVRVSFPSLFEPNRMNDSDPGKYQATAMIPKTDEFKPVIKEINDEIKRLASEKWSGKVPKNLKLALKDGDADDNEREEYKGHYVLTARSNQKPGVVDQRCDVISDSAAIMAGDYINMSFVMFAYDNSGNKGVSAGLNNVQFVKKGEPLGNRSRAEDEFEVVEVGGDDDDLDMLG
ncbi:MAG: hypothetical protein CMK32_07755 [Porticoccaceae bacterium]|nr:hypothetical protein [Porticoccaceae bacterium]